MLNVNFMEIIHHQTEVSMTVSSIQSWKYIKKVAECMKYRFQIVENYLAEVLSGFQTFVKGNEEIPSLI